METYGACHQSLFSQLHSKVMLHIKLFCVLVLLCLKHSSCKNPKVIVSCVVTKLPEQH